eukprot:TRINITY_DN29846_c0_g1_i1.p1 TRINITY_DN29846_c0_g1~~TRINITY_DN29846_c0_g1_i1.p1  ORF type:complete len:711 (-),score=129.33 TRINITY_DN29846_c0_g1_i1:115-2247(-)
MAGNAYWGFCDQCGELLTIGNKWFHKQGVLDLCHVHYLELLDDSRFHYVVVDDASKLADESEVYKAPVGHTLQFASSAKIVFLKPSWIVDQAAAGGTFLRRQDIEERFPDAFWDYSKVATNMLFEESLLVVSHPWESMEHCDPSGSQMRRLAKFLSVEMPISVRSDVQGVFLDMSSLYQFPRTEDQQQLFDLAAKDIFLLYIADHVKTMRLQEIELLEDKTQTVEVYSSEKGGLTTMQLQALSWQQDIAYGNRGWCVAERSWIDAKMMGHLNYVIGPSSPVGFLCPEDFDKQVDSEELRFSHHSDAVLVKHQFEQVFYIQAARTSEFKLSEALPAAQIPRTIKAMSRLQRLRYLEVPDVRIWSNASLAKLAQELASCPGFPCLRGFIVRGGASEEQLAAMVAHASGRWLTLKDVRFLNIAAGSVSAETWYMWYHAGVNVTAPRNPLKPRNAKEWRELGLRSMGNVNYDDCPWRARWRYTALECYTMALALDLHDSLEKVEICACTNRHLEFLPAPDSWSPLSCSVAFSEARDRLDSCLAHHSLSMVREIHGCSQYPVAEVPYGLHPESLKHVTHDAEGTLEGVEEGDGDGEAQQIVILHLSRSTSAVREELLCGQALKACRDALERHCYNPRLCSGVLAFVQPHEFPSVSSYAEREGSELKMWHVICSCKFEHDVCTALKKIRGKDHAHIKNRKLLSAGILRPKVVAVNP